MAAAVGALDEAIKEYLLYRGFTQTLKQLELEKKDDKDKGFRVTRIVDYILGCIYRSDLPALQSFWIHVNKRFFSRLSQESLNTAYKLEASILKLFLVHASKAGRQDEVRMFFERMCDALHERKEWKDWFALPFTRNPEQQPPFKPYFSKEWADMFVVTLHNFFSTLFTSLPLPSLLNFESEHQKMESLATENKLLHTQLAAAKHAQAEAESSSQRLDTRMSEVEAKLTHTEARLADQIASQASTAKRRAGTAANKTNRTTRQLPAWTGKKSGTFSSPSVVKKPLEREKSFEREGVVEEGEREEERGARSAGPSPHKGGRGPTLTRPKPRQLDLGSATSSSQEMDSDATPPSQDMDEGSITVHWESDGMAPFLPVSQEAYTGHSAPITHCKFSPNATQVASVDIDGVMRIWSPSSESLQTSATLELNSSLLSLDWVPQSDNLVLLGSADGMVKLYDCSSTGYLWKVCSDSKFPEILSIACSTSSFASSAATSSSPMVRSGYATSLSRMTFGLTSPALPSYRSSSASNEMQPIQKSTDGSVTGAVLIWDLKTQSQKCSLPLSPEPVAVNCMAFNHNSNLLLTGGTDGRIRLFDVFQQELLYDWQAHAGEVYGVQFSSDETALYSMGKDNLFCQWSVIQSGAKVVEFKVHEGACSPTAEWLIASEGRFYPRTPRGNLFAFESEDRFVLTCSAQEAVVYQVGVEGALTKVISIAGHGGPVCCVDWLHGRRSYSTCITGSVDSTVKVTNLLKSV